MLSFPTSGFNEIAILLHSTQWEVAVYNTMLCKPFMARFQDVFNLAAPTGRLSRQLSLSGALSAFCIARVDYTPNSQGTFKHINGTG